MITLRRLFRKALRRSRPRALGAGGGGDACWPAGPAVIAWDRQDNARCRCWRAGPNWPIRWRSTSPDSTAWSSRPACRSIRIRSPTRARSVGVPVIGDIELFALARADLPPHKVVGITGTNGKSTTTALVHHLLESAGRAGADGRQYRPADPGAGAAARRRRLCARTVELSDRPDLQRSIAMLRR